MPVALRRSATALLAVLLAVGAVLVAAPAAQAQPMPSTTVGSVTYNHSDPLNYVWRQNSPVAAIVAMGPLEKIAAGETLHIDQQPGQITILRFIDPSQIAGTITADETLVIEGTGGLTIMPTGSVSAGRALVVTGATSGVSDDAALPDLALDLSTSGSVQVEGTLAAGGGALLLAASDLSIGTTGAVSAAAGVPVHLTSAQTVHYLPASDDVTTAGSVVGSQLAVSGSATATGAVLRVDGGGGATTISGDLTAEPGVVEIVGGPVDADPGSEVAGWGAASSTVGALTGGSLATGDGTVSAATVRVGGDVGADIQTLTDVAATDVVIGATFAVPSIDLTCDATTAGFTTHLAIGGFDAAGTDLLAGVDTNLVGRPPSRSPGTAACSSTSSRRAPSTATTC